MRRQRTGGASHSIMPREVVAIDLAEIRTREDNPNQVREFNYIFQYSAIDSETGALIAENEFRTIASDIPLNLDVAKDTLTGLIETAQT
jgi:hypothetical protein